MATKQQLEVVLDTQVRPMLKSHGGEVRLVDWNGSTVLVELMGACSGCPSADLSTRGFIEDTLRTAFPEVREVELDRAVSPELMDFARKILCREDNR